MVNNKYFIEYNQIIDKAISENRVKTKNTYYENHHIIPRSIRPDLEDNKNNQVLLTLEEHFRCHELLTLFTEGIQKSKMLYAWNIMKNKTNLTGLDYNVIRKEFIDECRVRNSGENNPMYGKIGIDNPLFGRKHTEETKQKISKGNKGKKRTEEMNKKKF